MIWKRCNGGYSCEAGAITRADSHECWRATSSGRTLTFDLLRDAKGWCEREYLLTAARDKPPSTREVLNYAIADARRREMIRDAVGAGSGALLTQALLQCSACLALTDGLTRALAEWWAANYERVIRNAEDRP